MSDKTLEAYSIPIPPRLTGLLKQTLGRSGTGFDEGAFLQQLHYWTLNIETSGWVVDGIKWIYNSLKVWQTQLPWMSEYGLRKAIANLKKLGLIHTAQHWVRSYRRVMFYRIDYERLKAFAGELCDLIAPRRVNSDHIEMSPDHTTNTETSSKTSISEQQTDVVVQEAVLTDKETLDVEHEQGSEVERHNLSERDAPMTRDPGIGVEAQNSAETDSPASSGNNATDKPPMFPELINAALQALALPPGSLLPPPLKRAIAQHPERVQPAIAYLHHQQQKQRIKNPVGYLYEAIARDWNLSLSQNSILPPGFNSWYERMQRAGLVSAATTINGIHHTLHVQQGWVPTQQLMQQNPL